MTSANSKAFPFLNLPLELRETIYSLYFKPADRLVHTPSLQEQGFYGGVYKFDFGLYSVSRQVYKESQRVWRRENQFVKIATPWPSAGMYSIYLRASDQRELVDFGSGPLNHISAEGLVPIVCIDRHADAFDQHHAVVQINAPFHEAVPEHSVVVLLEDLHLFTQTWYYSALSYPMLNDRLSCTFILRDPLHPSQANDSQTADEPVPTVPLALQRRLLLPFEAVKGLYTTHLFGYDSSVRAELAARMLIPVPTLLSCVESATHLMHAGDAIVSQNPATALDNYIAAFKAIHILIHGRTRRILADVFFHEPIESGTYAGQSGMTVRVILRLQLVARCIAAHLLLRRWGDAAFWGMRSIRTMREAMGTEFEEFVTEFVGGSDVACIYMRTGVALWRMESEMPRWEDEVRALVDESLSGSRALWREGVRFFKNVDKGVVRRELERFGVDRAIVEEFGGTAGEDGKGVEA